MIPAKSALRFLALGAVIASICSCSRDLGLNPQQEFTLKAQCRDAGDKLSKEWRSRYSGVKYDEEPEFAYNAQLNSCLYSDASSDAITVVSEAHVYQHQFVMDVFTNRMLAEYLTDNGKATVDPKQPQLLALLEEFQKRKAQLLGYTRPGASR